MSKRKKPRPPIPVDLMLSDLHERRESQQPKPQDWPLSRAMFFYGRRLANQGDDIPHFCMLHDVGDGGQLGPGKPVDPLKFAQSIYRLKKGEALDPLFLCAGNVLAENREVIVWWEPASVRPMWFKTAERIPQLTALNGKSVPHPPLLFRAGKGEGAGLSVWAMLANERPSADTPLYHAPYCNRYPDGQICMGTARDRSLSKIKKHGPSDWMELFFDSNFSHTPPPLRYGKIKTETPVNPAAEIHATSPDEISRRRDRLVTYAAFLREIKGRKQVSQAERLFAEVLIPANRTVASVLRPQEPA